MTKVKLDELREAIKHIGAETQEGYSVFIEEANEKHVLLKTYDRTGQEIKIILFNEGREKAKVTYTRSLGKPNK